MIHYKMFLEGSTLHLIAELLTAEGIPTPCGKPFRNLLTDCRRAP
ncbi:MAG: recombinase family protein [Clostridiales bacterium]|nr:recombinase family protein [Clostridiales bacterium]